MNIFVIDTFEAIARLKDVGFTEPQAKEIIQTFKHVDTSTLSTKEDIAELKSDNQEMRNEVKSESQDIRNELRSEIKNLHNELAQLELRINARFEKIIGEMNLLKWMFGLVLATNLTILFRLFFPHG